MDSLFDFLEERAQRQEERMYLSVILPLPLHKLYTYSVPIHLKEQVKVGLRVEVQFGKNKLYAGLIYKIHQQAPEHYEPKPILAILDEEPLVLPKQFKLWEWMSDYYVAKLGEIMNAALPAGLKLNSETKISLRSALDETDMSLMQLSEKEALIIESLIYRPEIGIDEIQKLLEQKTVYPIIKKLIDKQLVVVREELKQKYKSKSIDFVKLSDYYEEDSNRLKQAFELIGSRAHRQMEALMAFLQLQRNGEKVKKKELYLRAQIDSTVLKKLVEKGILKIYSEEISRLSSYDEEGIGNYTLSTEQQCALEEVESAFEEKNVVLLHGVTGSGKTQVFVELMQKTMDQGKQVLYLLPEIALTAQIVARLQKHFGDQIAVYHSKFNNNERVEIWQSILEGKAIILGARSALFLPFKDLGLIIVDEEHDSSYKQMEPSPRYNARDAAVFMSYLYKAKTLLGSATPSLESYRNVQQKKYGLVEMKQRFGNLALPKIHLVDIAEEQRRKRMKSHFSPQLLEAIEETLANKEQVILFQNRRGYAPVYKCQSCGWTAPCTDCDISLTYHKHSHRLHCHYCSYKQALPKVCGACGNPELSIKGFGTEKIEDELKIFLPDARIARMDWDTVKGKNGHEKIIQLFESKSVDVLVGTQMVSKGLDFDNVGLVGVLNADQMLHFPDFRATERAFQLLLQVSGRAGRKKKQGKVLIQTYKVDHPVLREVQQNAFELFLQRELKERYEFSYPPFNRLVKIVLKHKKQDIVTKAAQFLGDYLKKELGSRVLGPAVPGISRVRTYYLMDILIKMGKSSQILGLAKQLVGQAEIELKSQKGFASVRIIVNVDPY